MKKLYLFLTAFFIVLLNALVSGQLFINVGTEVNFGDGKLKAFFIGNPAINTNGNKDISSNEARSEIVTGDI